MLYRNIAFSNFQGIASRRFMRQVFSKEAPAPVGPYSQAVQAGDTLYLSGQLGLDPQTCQLVSDECVKSQADQALKNIRAVLTAAGGDMEDVVQCTLLLTDMKDFEAVNEVYAKYFADSSPARMCFAVKQLPKNAKMEIAAVAHIKQGG